MIGEFSSTPVVHEDTLDTLRARVAELELENAKLRRAAGESEGQRKLLQRVLDALPPRVFWKDRSSVYLGCNEKVLADANKESLVGLDDYALPWTPEQAEGYRADDRQVMESGQAKVHIHEKLLQAGGDEIWVETNKVPIRDDDGRVIGIVGTFEDITARKLEELEFARQREEVIAAQAEQLSELSTPLLPIHDKVLVMPLIGRMDEARGRAVMERLLEGVVRHQAELVILDLTGVPVVNGQIASGVLDVVRAAELLGARVMLTGLRPELAKTIVELGLDLGRVATRATLRDGVAEATRASTARTGVEKRAARPSPW
jgi:rsbT co-antagonist protein RsbR